ncbi:MAG: Molybdenum cofactor biosynthesis protein F, partial [Candidatus Kentron sp. G]
MTSDNKDWLRLMLALESLEEGFDEHRLPLTDKLAGQKFELYPEGEEGNIFIHFKDASQAEWRLENEPRNTEHYEAMEVRPDIFFVDWVSHADPKKSLSIVLDLVSRESTLLWSQLPSAQDARADLFERIKRTNDLSAVKTHIVHGGVDGERTKKIHGRTADLVGKRLKHTYSNKHAFEHIYLNERLFCWQSLEGPDKGLADTEPVDYIKIAEDLYLFSWRERIVPWVGIVLIDLVQMRTAGKVFYGDIADPDKVTNYTVGARVSFSLLRPSKFEGHRPTIRHGCRMALMVALNWSVEC